MLIQRIFANLREKPPLRFVVAVRPVFIPIAILLTAWPATQAQSGPAIFNFGSFTSPTNLLMQGLPSIVSERLRLTDSSTGQTGGAWYPTKVTVDQGFQTDFQFQIYDQVNGGGDGFAFVIQNGAVPQLGNGGGGIGYNQVRNSIVVEFDTYHDSFDPPQTNSPFRELSIHSNGVLPNNVTNGPTTLITTQNFTNFADGNIHLAEVDYTQGTLSLYLDGSLAITTNINLDTLLALDNGQAWIGFTGGTGAAWERHDICNWSYAVPGVPIAVAVTNPQPGSVFTVPAVVSFGAAAETTNAEIAEVTYYDGTNFLGRSSNAPWSLTLSNMAPGRYYVTAVAQDNTGATCASMPQLVTVQPPLSPVGFNFAVGADDASTNALDSPQSAGFIVQSNWNNVLCDTNGNGSLASAVESTGELTAVGVSVDAFAPGNEENYKTSFSADYVLMASYLEDLGPESPAQTNSTIAVSNIPYGAYDVLVYACGENHEGLADRVGRFTIGSQSIFLRDAANTDFGGWYAEAAGAADLGTNTPSGNFVRFRGLTSEQFTLTFVAGSAFNTTPMTAVNALQIIPTSVLPSLNITSAGTNVVLSWPTNFPGFTLQFTPDLTAAWTNVIAAPAITSGRYFLTNAATGNAGFYRLHD